MSCILKGSRPIAAAACGVLVRDGASAYYSCPLRYLDLAPVQPAAINV